MYIHNLPNIVKKVLQKGYTPNWSEEVVEIKKVNNTVSLTYVIIDVSSEEIGRTFYRKEFQKNQKKFRVEKAIEE